MLPQNTIATIEIHLLHDKTLLIDSEDFDRISGYTWFSWFNGYQWYAISHKPKPQKGVIYLHRFITNALDGQKVDHIDGNGMNNTKRNLRFCTQAQNGFNRGPNKNNTSGYKGVIWDKKNGLWCAQIKFTGKCIRIGRYGSIEDAARAYDSKALELFGEFAYTNFSQIPAP